MKLAIFTDIFLIHDSLPFYSLSKEQEYIKVVPRLLKMKKELLHKLYALHKDKIKRRLLEFNSLDERNYFHELLFCLLTPQSNAKKCWDAVEQLKRLDKLTSSRIIKILKTRTRFHNNKSSYILEAEKQWASILPKLANNDRKELRNWLAENTKGMGYKEAGHFLRNIGKSDNQIAVLDRHILRNLHDLGVISQEDVMLKNKNHYFSIENKFLAFSHVVSIPIDELDLLFWSHETGEIFK